MISPIQLVRYLHRAPEVVLASRQTPAYWQVMTRYLQIGPGAYPVEVPLNGGGSLTLSSAAEVKVFWHVFVRGSYVLPKRCTTILDCGANVGIFSVWAASQRPQARIVAVEPFPDTYTGLVANIRQNHLDDRVRCVNMALAADSGERQMRTDGDSPNRQVVLCQDDGPCDRTVPVSCISLAECLDRFGMATLDVLKMDIEGSEWAVLLSTPPDVLRRIGHIQLEYHEVNERFGYTPEQLFAHLAAAGHTLTFRTEDRHRTGLARFERSM
jgi:FkbM family methyltransferase